MLRPWVQLSAPGLVLRSASGGAGVSSTLAWGALQDKALQGQGGPDSSGVRVVGSPQAKPGLGPSPQVPRKAAVSPTAAWELAGLLGVPRVKGLQGRLRAPGEGAGGGQGQSGGCAAPPWHGSGRTPPVWELAIWALLRDCAVPTYCTQDGRMGCPGAVPMATEWWANMRPPPPHIVACVGGKSVRDFALSQGWLAGLPPVYLC